MNKYQVTGVIDEGAYGVVMKAVNKLTGQWVAIKRFKDSDEDQSVYRNIQREIQMLKSFKGEYVVELKQAFRKKGRVYLIFQFMEKNLLNVIEQHEEGLPRKLVSQLVYRIVRAIYFLHSHNVIHRDIKPENLLITQSPDILLKICDFGFTRIISNLKMTEYVATRWYRSPELLVGQRYGKEVDIWAVGCIMGEMLSGQPMFPGENELDQIYLIQKTFGSLTPSQQGILKSSERFRSVKLPEVKIREPLQVKYLNKMEKVQLSFMKGCLKLDSSQRLTALQALRHPYLKQYSDQQFLVEEQNQLINLRKKSHPEFLVAPKAHSQQKSSSMSGKKFSLQTMFSKQLGKQDIRRQFYSPSKLFESTKHDTAFKGETVGVLPKLPDQKSVSVSRSNLKASSVQLKIGKIKTIYTSSFQAKLRQSKQRHIMKRR